LQRSHFSFGGKGAVFGKVADTSNWLIRNAGNPKTIRDGSLDQIIDIIGNSWIEPVGAKNWVEGVDVGNPFEDYEVRRQLPWPSQKSLLWCYERHP